MRPNWTNHLRRQPATWRGKDQKMETRETLRAAKMTNELTTLQDTHQVTQPALLLCANSRAPSAMQTPTQLMKRLSSTWRRWKFASLANAAARLPAGVNGSAPRRPLEFAARSAALSGSRCAIAADGPQRLSLGQARVLMKYTNTQKVQ